MSNPDYPEGVTEKDIDRIGEPMQEGLTFIEPYVYKESMQLSLLDYQFYALIMAAMRKAGTENSEKLKEMFPDVFAYYKHCYNCPGCKECQGES